jgi:hypothetical protein
MSILRQSKDTFNAYDPPAYSYAEGSKKLQTINHSNSGTELPPSGLHARQKISAIRNSGYNYCAEPGRLDYYYGKLMGQGQQRISSQLVHSRWNHNRYAKNERFTPLPMQSLDGFDRNRNHEDHFIASFQTANKTAYNEHRNRNAEVACSLETVKKNRKSKKNFKRIKKALNGQYVRGNVPVTSLTSDNMATGYNYNASIEALDSLTNEQEDIR